ncbi:MAG: hypothetical protein U0Q15_00330 [Kineosporiaceae bacterium]
MPEVLKVILYLVAAACFALSAFRITSGRNAPRIDLIALGLLAWVLVPLLELVLD